MSYCCEPGSDLFSEFDSGVESFEPSGGCEREKLAPRGSAFDAVNCELANLPCPLPHAINPRVDGPDAIDPEPEGRRERG